jgi:hypothetical protein
LNAEPANPSLALHHNLMDLPPTHINSSLLQTLDITTCLSCFQERVVVIMEKRGAMAVTSGSLGLNNTLCNTIIVGQ